MEKFIANLVKDFDSGKLGRREFCQSVHREERGPEGGIVGEPDQLRYRRRVARRYLTEAGDQSNSDAKNRNQFAAAHVLQCVAYGLPKNCYERVIFCHW